MKTNIHLEMLREGPTSVWLKISAAPGDPPVVERSLNLLSLVETSSTLASLKEAIEAICREWYATHVNLEAYCAAAVQWRTRITHDRESVAIAMATINGKKAQWCYELKGKPYFQGLRFTESTMCLDWVGAEGLNKAAQDFIVQSVRDEIDRDVERNLPDRVTKRSLVLEFLRPLPAHRDPVREAAFALAPRLDPHHSLVGEIAVP